MNMQPHPVPNHARPHSHTPPHQYQQPPVQQRQPPPPQQMQQQQQQQPHPPKLQMNGDAKGAPPTRQQRVYQNQQYPPEMKPEVVQIQQGHPSRHRDETMKDLHQFAQDFKLAPMSNEQPPQMQPPPPPQVVEQVVSVIYLQIVGSVILYLRLCDFLDSTTSAGNSAS